MVEKNELPIVVAAPQWSIRGHSKCSTNRQCYKLQTMTKFWLVSKGLENLHPTSKWPHFEECLSFISKKLKRKDPQSVFILV